MLSMHQIEQSALAEKVTILTTMFLILRWFSILRWNQEYLHGISPPPLIFSIYAFKLGSNERAWGYSSGHTMPGMLLSEVWDSQSTLGKGPQALRKSGNFEHFKCEYESETQLDKGRKWSVIRSFAAWRERKKKNEWCTCTMKTKHDCLLLL